MAKTNSRLQRRVRRHKRLRNTIRGLADKPRLSVFRSAKHIYVQAIDDVGGRTLASASTMDKALRDQVQGSAGNAKAAGVVGKAIAERLQAAGVAKVVFDRGGYRYHGRVKALADAAREGGLQF